MTPIALAAAVVVLTCGCSVARISGQTGYVVPLRGQTEAKMSQDKYDCFESARAPRGTTAARAMDPGFDGNAARTAAAVLSGGVVAMGVTGMVTSEVEELHRNPPDLVKYRQCMPDKGYELHQ